MKKYFVSQAVKEAEVENFIRHSFPMGDYSKTELQRTPLGLKIIIYTNKPGRIIGKGGKNINDITEALREKFKIENPQVDVKSIEHPDLDAKIVAKQIASALERGFNFRKIGNLTMQRIMGAGAAGAQIVISGVLAGGKSGQGKFIAGYMKHCGQPAKDLVDYGFEIAITKRGTIGIKVKIMKSFMDVTGRLHPGGPKKSLLDGIVKEEEPKKKRKKKDEEATPAEGEQAGQAEEARQKNTDSLDSANQAVGLKKSDSSSQAVAEKPRETAGSPQAEPQKPEAETKAQPKNEIQNSGTDELKVEVVELDEEARPLEPRNPSGQAEVASKQKAEAKAQAKPQPEAKHKAQKEGNE